MSKDTNADKMLPHNIILILQDSNFWNQLYELQDLLFPLCGVLNKLQKDVAQLHEIVHYFGWLINVFANHKDDYFSDHMVAHLENRWAQWEQPLLLLLFILHSKYQLS